MSSAVMDDFVDTLLLPLVLNYYLPIMMPLLFFQVYLLLQFLELSQFLLVLGIFAYQRIKRSLPPSACLAGIAFLSAVRPRAIVRASLDWFKMSFLLSLPVAFIPGWLIISLLYLFIYSLIYLLLPALGLLSLKRWYNYLRYVQFEDSHTPVNR